MIDKEKILAGRKAVKAYRTAHTALHREPWRKTIPEEHTPLLNIMLGAFKGLGFNSLQEFFDASNSLNIQELGFASREDFLSRAKDADREGLRVKWS